VISADGHAISSYRGASEFSAPDDEGVVEHSALFEIKNESGAGLVDILADLFEVLVEVFTGAAVAVPVGVIELHEA